MIHIEGALGRCDTCKNGELIPIMRVEIRLTEDARDHIDRRLCAKHLGRYVRDVIIRELITRDIDHAGEIPF